MIVMTARSDVDENEVSPQYWVPATMGAGVMVIYSLIHAIMFVAGMWQSCYQYRSELIKHMQATGPLVGAVQGRISCSAVFDFMDYIHPNLSYERQRYDRIDTAWCMRLASISTIATFALWSATFFINFSQARRTSKLRV